MKDFKLLSIKRGRISNIGREIIQANNDTLFIGQSIRFVLSKKVPNLIRGYFIENIMVQDIIIEDKGLYVITKHKYKIRKDLIQLII